MKKSILGLLCLLLPLMANAATRDYTRDVNLFIGTAGHGHTNPAAIVPHGMIQPGPDTRWHEWDACSGYYYADTTINGFAHTRLSGTGCADFGDFLLMPTVGEQRVAYAGEKEPGHQQMPYCSAFSHERETAVPGYYAVRLDTYGVTAELTATERAAIHRYTFPASEKAGFILDLDYSIQGQQNLEMDVEVIDNQTVRAHRRSLHWAYDQELWFYARFSKPFTYTVLRDTVKTAKRDEPRCKLLLNFATEPGEQVLVKASISPVDYAGAEKNLNAEIPCWDFEGVRHAAKAKWNKVLSKISLSDDTSDEQRKIFYTALYHTNVSPSIFSDVDGRYRGMDLKVHHLSDYGQSIEEPNYTIFSLWDTFRALHPLVSILDPAQNDAYIRALIRKGEEGGIVPKWECASNYTGCMIGYHFVSLAADAYAKGSRGFDVEKAYRAGRRLAEYDPAGITPTLPQWKLDTEIMPIGRKYKNELGYIPCDKENESVARALEYAYDDWCIAQLAKAVGDKEGEKKYTELGKAYRHYFHPTLRFMRGKDIDGKWRTPFDPRRSQHRADDYCEGNAWQWTWFVPHDVEGLMKLMGGKKKFIGKLDSLFSAPSEITGNLISADISGLIGQYAHGNEPSHHITHLYNYAGQPWRTQELVDSVLHSLYFNDPNGLAGNEDCGQMSAWYILNSLGFYQVCPGRPVWSIGRPLFAEAVINLPNGKTFTVRTKGNSRTAKYIREATLNGKPLKTPFFTHAQLAAGGTLELTMSETPERWGAK